MYPCLIHNIRPPDHYVNACTVPTLGAGSFASASEGDIITQEDTVFVQGLDESATPEQIAAHFGQIGMVKVYCVMGHSSTEIKYNS